MTNPSQPEGEITLLQRLRYALRNGTADPAEVAREALARANGNASHNTYLWLDEKRVLGRAEALKALYSEPEQRPALYGLPVSLKDCFDLAGTVTTAGTLFYAEKNRLAESDSAVAARLLTQGAVIVGKTHLHPLAYGITGENPEYGDCVQPGRPSLLTGGSSSGAAASVREGSAVAAIGTDTGGSIRVPAALCGIAGYRCSHSVSRGMWTGGAHLAPSFDTIGWLYRDLEDGPWLASALFDLPVAEPWARPRIAYVEGEFLSACEPAVLATYDEVRQQMQAAGATTTPVDVTFWRDAVDIFAPIQAHEAAALHAGHFDAFEPAIRDRLTWGASISREELAGLRQRQSAFVAAMNDRLRGFDLLMLPAAPVAELRAGADHAETRRRILPYTVPVSLAGLPAVTISGVAGGVQVAGTRQGSDLALLEWTARIGSLRRGLHDAAFT